MQTPSGTTTEPRRSDRRSAIAVGAIAIAATLLATLLGAPQAQATITRKKALNRPDVIATSGDLTDPWRVCASSNETYDIRGLTSTGNFEESNLSIGNDCGGSRVVSVGGTVIGTISHSLGWDEVKSTYDGAGLRFEGDVWMAAFGLSVQNVEDGFRPRVADSTGGQSSVWFMLSGAYMDWIRDDAVEDDDLMSGVIKNVLIDGTNRFLSARPPESSDRTNNGMSVKIRDVLVHMKEMPNDRDEKDGTGFGGIFKWSDAAGTVDMSRAIVLLDEQPLTKEPFPPGVYSHVTIVLGPGFKGRYPGNLPDGVHVTRRMTIWTRARTGWLEAHT